MLLDFFFNYFILFLFKKLILKMINNFFFRKMTWQSFCHISAAVAMSIWLNLQPTNPEELTTFPKDKKTSNELEEYILTLPSKAKSL